MLLTLMSCSATVVSLLQSISLFDMGAHMSYVNRHVAAWITDLANRGSNGMRTRIGHSVPTSSVSLAGTSKINKFWLYKF